MPLRASTSIGPNLQALWLALAIGFSLTGCASAALAYAPRTSERDPPPKPQAQVKLTELGKPSCDYDVIGSAFGTSLDRLVEVAADHGGDGVYDTSCQLERVGSVMNTSIGVIDTRHTNQRCDGRVYVCRSGSTASSPKESGDDSTGGKAR